MPHFNQITMLGHLTADPELKYTTSGVAICKFSIAVNSPYTDKDGNKQEKTCFIDVDVWDKQGENCAQYLAKGKAVLVSGSLEQSKWQDNNGNNRSKHSIKASVVQFLSPRESNGEDNVAKEDDTKVPF